MTRKFSNTLKFKPPPAKTIKEKKMTENKCDHPSAEKIDQFVQTSIKKHGWCCMGVFAEEGSPAFSYSIGFNLLNHPEIIVCGLPNETAHELMSEVYRRIKKGTMTIKDGDTFDDLANMPLHFIKISESAKQKMMLLTNKYYNHWDFDALQMIWPDPAGRFPWNERFDQEYSAAQLLLYK